MRGLNEPIPAPDWMPKNLPGRLRMSEAGKLLGFTDDEMRYLVAQKHIKLLGSPDQFQIKWFCTAYITRLLVDEGWMRKATDLAYIGNRSKKNRGGDDGERLAA